MALFNLLPPEELILPRLESAPNIKEYDWLEQTSNLGERLNWAAYQSSFNRLIRKPITKMSMLPLFLESSNSPPMMLHSMNVDTECVKYLNPNQTPVLVDKFGVMVGGLHIAEAALRMAGHLLEGSAWVEMITKSEITTKGKAEGAFKVSHIKKARHIHDSSSIVISTKQERNPDVLDAFENDAFVTRKTERSFLAFALDHAHGQLNSVLKSDGGIVGLTQNIETLRRFMVAGLELARMLHLFEERHCYNKPQLRHHEETLSCREKFSKHVDAIVLAVEIVGNPFGVANGDLHRLDDHVVMGDKVAASIMAIEKEGQEQFQEFASNYIMSKEKVQKLSLKTDCALFSRLHIACQEREGNLDEFFRHENQPYPPSLCEYGFPRACNKADLIKALHNHIPTLLPPSEPSVDAKIFDGATVIHMIKPGDEQTFQEYIENKYLPYMEKQKNSVQCIDIVWDIYKSDSLKQGTRHSDLFFRQNVYREYKPCNHEEADTCIFLHVADAAKRGLPRVLIRATDTDVVAIGVSMYQDMGLEELWLSFGRRAFPEATDAFVAIYEGNLDSAMDKMEKFVIILYDRSCKKTLVNEARREMFRKKKRTMEMIPPTANALYLQAKR
ncbi:hypothetical protein PR048_007970 [Dryococelus australis]|uniref:Uncharacterized protein n=1 Tax=Dryococelus australis TaxID=614101 RepID=A0ABQ9HVR8_9NEOP|nr:hypothetical protein PR048_007970 [Dryococelus australis]